MIAETFKTVSTVYILSLSITGCEEIGTFLFSPFPIEVFQNNLIFFSTNGCKTLCASLFVTWFQVLLIKGFGNETFIPLKLESGLATVSIKAGLLLIFSLSSLKTEQLLIKKINK